MRIGPLGRSHDFFGIRVGGQAGDIFGNRAIE